MKKAKPQLERGGVLNMKGEKSEEEGGNSLMKGRENFCRDDEKEY